ncbi:RDD family protein [Streptomyces sodiiphilus]|uniref:RDD family protein n=1 Tax=Streptomyces sodiiphilus TaxID=226217 RepID=A0ABN2PUD3_9ACTN
MSNQQPPPGPGDPEPEPPEPDGFSGLPPPPPGGDDTAFGGPPPDRYGSNPYGGAHGASDPLAGMPPLGNLGRRFVARVIDALVVGVPVILVLWPMMGGYGEATDARSYVQQAVLLLLYFLYEGVMFTARGQTLGKMAMGLRVAMLDNGAVPRGNAGWFRSAVYALVLLVPCIGLLFWLFNVLSCTWDRPYRQCVHDKAAKTVVVSAS